MPDRIIRERSLTSPTLNELSDAAERTFWRLTVAADDHGLFEAEPTLLLAKLYPRRVGVILPQHLEAVRDELARTGLVELYEVDRRIYGRLVNWAKYQRRRDSKPKFPTPDDPAAVRRDLPQPAANGGESPQLAGVARARVGREPRAESREKRAESRETARPRRGGKPPPVAELVGFAEWYAVYPVKKDRQSAERAWAGLSPSDDLRRQLCDDVQRRKVEDADWVRGAIPYPATYLNGRRWEDDVVPARGRNGAHAGSPVVDWAKEAREADASDL